MLLHCKNISRFPLISFQVDVKKNNRVLDIYEHMNFDAINIEDIREQLQNPKYYQVHRFTYDYVFNEKSKQQEVYEVAAKQAIASTLKVSFSESMVF